MYAREARNRFRIVSLATALVAAGSVADLQAQATRPATEARAPGLGTTDFDRSIRPQDDFHEFVNGSWLRRTEIPTGRSEYGAWAELHDRTRQRVREIVEEAVAVEDAGPSSASDVAKDARRSHRYALHPSRSGSGLPVPGERSGVATIGSQSPSRDLEDLYARIDSIRQANDVPAAQVAVILPDTTVLWNFGAEQSGEPVTSSTLFRAGSISKTFAGLSMLMLAERGLVSLDTPLAELAPELPIRNPWRATHPVRLSHLLEAGAGFVGFLPQREQPVRSADAGRVDLQHFIETLPFRLDAQWRPGDYSAYHNLGPVITAHLIEKIAGRPYEEFVRENLFDPLGMERASYFLTPTVATRLADTTVYAHIGGYWPSGALNTSAGELAALVRMLLNRGTYEGRRLLSPASVERFESPTSTLTARKLGVQLGHAINNWTTRFRGVRYHGHGGRIAGYTAYYAYSPEHGSGFVYMGRLGPSGEALHYPVMKAVLSHLHPTISQPAARAVTPEEQRALPGCYVLANPRSLEQRLRHVRIEAESGRLFLIIPDAEGSARWTLEPDAHPDVFRVRGERPLRPGRPDEALVAFVTDEDGTLVMQHLEHGHEAFVRTPCR